MGTLNEGLSFIASLESDGRNIYNTENTKGGYFQIPNDEMVTLLSDLSMLYKENDPDWKEPEWMEAAKVHQDATKLDPDQQRALALIKLTKDPDSKELLNKAVNGDVGAWTDLYLNYYNPSADGEERAELRAYVEDRMQHLATLNYKYESPEFATYGSEEDWWLTAAMKSTYAGRRFVRWTGGEGGDLNAFRVGYKMSVHGMMMAYADGIKKGEDPKELYQKIFMHEASSFTSEMIQSVMQLVGDVPTGLVGFFGGFGGTLAVTSATGQVWAAPAAPFVGFGASFGLPEALRDTYIRAILNDDVNSFDEFMNEFMKTETAVKFAKYFVVGGGTYSAGRLVKAGGGNRTTQLAAEVPAMVALMSAVEGQVPTRKDFVHAAVLMFGIHGASKGIGSLYNVYKKYGYHPRDQFKLFRKRADVAADYTNGIEPNIFRESNEFIIENLEKKANIKLVPAEKFKKGEDVKTSIEGSENGKVLDRIEGKDGTVYYIVERPNGETTKVAEQELQKAERDIDFDVEVDGTKVKIVEKVKDFDEGKKKGEFTEDVEVYTERTKDASENFLKIDMPEGVAQTLDTGNIGTGGARTVISTGKAFANKDFIINKEFYPKLSETIKTSVDNVKNKTSKIADLAQEYFSIKAKKFSKADKTIVVKKDGISGEAADTLVLRNADGHFSVNRKMFDSMSRYIEKDGKGRDVNVEADIAVTDGFVIFLQSGTTKPIGYLRANKTTGKTEQQSKNYYDNYARSENRTYYDKYKASKGDEAWGAPEEPAGGPMPNRNLFFKDLFNNHKGLDTIDLVQMVEVLTDNPVIVEKLKPNLRGYFRSVEGKPEAAKVVVNKILAENPKDFMMTLAHEIGHLIDYLPDATMKKGNILGSLASMKGYMNKWIDGKADGARPLDAKEIRALKKEAEKRAEQKNQKDLDALETSALGKEGARVTPDTIVKIFNDPEARAKVHPDFYNVFVGLSDALKKQVVKDAMKGLMNEHMVAIANKINKQGNVNQGVLADAQVEFAKMFEAEMSNRGLVNREMITIELKKLSQKWKPFDRARDRKYTEYRDSPRELMADFMMAFLLRPNWTRVNAPKSFDLFMHHMYKKPEVKLQWEKIQNELAAGNNARMASVHEMIMNKFSTRGEELAQAKENRWSPNEMDAVHTTWVDVFGYFYRRFGHNANGWRGRGETRWRDSDSRNLNWRIEDFRYRHTYMQRYMTEIVNKVVTPLGELGVNQSALSLMLLYRNLVNSPQRAGVANPFGLWAEIKEIGADGLVKKQDVEGRTARELYDDFRAKNPKVDELATEFFKLRQEYMMPVLKESKFFDAADMAKILDNTEYVTYSVSKKVLEKIEKYGNFKMATKAIRKTEGTLGDTMDPFAATLEKDMLLLTELKLNRLKYDSIEYMIKNKAWLERFDRKDFTKDKVIQKAKMKKYPNQNEPEPAPQGMTIVDVVVDGKTKYYYMNKQAAAAFERNPYMWFEGIQYLSAFNTFFRSIFTEYNPLFWGKNMFRDVQRAVRNLPNASLFDLKGGFKNSYLKYLMKSIRPTYKSIFGDMEGTALTKQMEKEGIYIAQMEGYRGNAGEKMLQKQLKEGTLDPSNYGVEQLLQRMKPKEYETFYQNTMGRFLDHMGNTARLLERMHKTAGYMYLHDAVARGELSMSSKEIMIRVQNDVGSPSFLRTGKLHPVSNNVFIFYNAMKEGVRADYVRIKEDPVSTLGKMFMYNTAPKMLQKMMKYGLYGWGLSEFYSGVSEYDEQNYIIIPLGYTESGKTVYFRIPQDETARLINGIIGKTVDAMMGEADITDFGATISSDMMPSVNPAIELFGDMLTIGMGHNPINSFTGEYAIDPTIWEASDNRTKIAAFQYMWNTYGGGALYRFKTDDPTAITDELEEIFAYPMVGTFANTFIKVGKHPKAQQVKKKLMENRKNEARQLLDYREAINLILTDQVGKMQPRHKMAVAMRADNFKKNPYLKAMLAKNLKGTDLLKALLLAKTPVEKVLIMKEIANYEKAQMEMDMTDLDRQLIYPLLIQDPPNEDGEEKMMQTIINDDKVLDK